MRKVLQVCEVCVQREANHLTHNRTNGRWYYTCSACLGDGYNLSFKGINTPPHGLDWYEHMSKKLWVDMESFTPRLLWIQTNFKKASVHG